jgi:tripartite-type tricarboxylate transporter receptor subunit TctC
MWGFLAGLLPFIRAGSLKALAIGSRERSPALPELPTVAEAGVPGYDASSWIGLLAPAGTPRPAITRLWEAVNVAMQDPSVRDLLLRDGSDVVVSTPEAFRRAIEEDDAKYAKLSGLLAKTK